MLLVVYMWNYNDMLFKVLGLVVLLIVVFLICIICYVKISSLCIDDYIILVFYWRDE